MTAGLGVAAGRAAGFGATAAAPDGAASGEGTAAVRGLGAGPAASPSGGTWARDHGSVPVIRSVGADGSLPGTYTNNAPGYRCAGTAFPLAGWTDGPRISHAVRWKNASLGCTSITAWTGDIHDGRLGVEWVLTYEEDGGSNIRIGSDSYRRQ